MASRQCFAGLFFVFLGMICLFGQYTPEDWNARDQWMDVGKILDLADVKMGSKVADVGCHEGYLTFRLSPRVGPKGTVFAVDISSHRLERLRRHLQERNVANVEVILGKPDNPLLPSNQLDAVILMDTYHEIKAYREVLVHIRKALKPNGRILILEKLKEHKRDGSRISQTEAHTLSPKYVREELEEAGFEILKEIGDFGNWKEDVEKPMWILVGGAKAL